MRFPHATRRRLVSCSLAFVACGMSLLSRSCSLARSLTIPRSLSRFSSFTLQLYVSLSLSLFLPLPLCFSQAIKSRRTALIATISKLNEQKANDPSPIAARSRRDLDAIFSRSSLSLGRAHPAAAARCKYLVSICCFVSACFFRFFISSRSGVCSSPAQSSAVFYSLQSLQSSLLTTD